MTLDLLFFVGIHHSFFLLLSKEAFSLRDVTEDCKKICAGVRDLTSRRNQNYTLIYIVDIFRGIYINPLVRFLEELDSYAGCSVNDISL